MLQNRPTQQGRKVPPGDTDIIADQDQLQQHSSTVDEDYEDYEDDRSGVIILQEFHNTGPAIVGLDSTTMTTTSTSTMATPTTTSTTMATTTTTVPTWLTAWTTSTEKSTSMPSTTEYFDTGLPPFRLLQEPVYNQYVNYLLACSIKGKWRVSILPNENCTIVTSG